jgi:hypothetical protein
VALEIKDEPKQAYKGKVILLYHFQ